MLRNVIPRRSVARRKIRCFTLSSRSIAASASTIVRLLHVLMDPSAGSAAEDHYANEEHRDACGHDADITDAHADRDDDGPGAPVVFLFFPGGLRMRHPPRSAVVDKPGRYNIFGFPSG